MKSLLYSCQYIDGNDIDEVVKVLKSDWITQGPKIGEFEAALCEYTSAKYSVALSSGTAALHLSLLTLGIGKGDKIITSPITFSASANCALYVGARPLFVDIDDKTYHLDIEKLKSFLKVPSNRKGVKAIVSVHFMGTVADIAEMKKICDRYGISIVEDAAHALGAAYKFKDKWIKVGRCEDSKATIFSFHPIKQITTGEGGALLTNDKKIYKSALRLRHHGIVRSSKKPWSYDIPQVGFNYRITDFQCALGISQLKKIDKMINIRRRIVGYYNESLRKVEGIRLPYEREGTNASYHLYVIRMQRGRRDKLYSYLKENNISTQVNYIPLHLLSYYRNLLGYRRGDFLVSERYSAECLSLPLYVGLSRRDQSKVIKRVREFFQ
ncbi:MAG: UDP-4-amino-4,6-dideoxy-N-acetyl-beta-L-altrosamine transaminase [Candidatus Omnitrophica bacterium]|nr:UDP-4-amino-4,6-dideoxy-N-acetyl-beta-L-altrosamine transaminase [Candidatus Omnitrophota bacterium]